MIDDWERLESAKVEVLRKSADDTEGQGVVMFCNPPKFNHLNECGLANEAGLW